MVLSHVISSPGADIDAADNNGETPLTVAETFGNKVCERHLFLFRWQQRAKQTLKNKMQVDMFAHQYFDSTNPVWFKGKHGQIYLTQILPPGEFEGTSFNAPLRRSDTYTDEVNSDSDCESDGEIEMYQLDTKDTRTRTPIRRMLFNNYINDNFICSTLVIYEFTLGIPVLWFSHHYCTIFAPHLLLLKDPTVYITDTSSF